MGNEFNKKEIYPSPSKSFSFNLEPISDIKDEALIILDANVLLLPFTTDVKNVEAIKELYQALVANDQIFLPAQAVREYLDNRAKKLADINESLQKKSNQSFGFVGAHPLLGSLEQYQEVLALEAGLKDAIKAYQKQIRETLTAVQAWGWNDPVSKMYHEVLSERVLNDDELNLEEISQDLARRNKLKLPPGYKDGGKEQNQAGDLLIWHELLNLAIARNKHVIFVSGDEKADWWHQSGKAALYPRFELVDEFREKTDGRSFHILSLSKLLKLFETDDEVVESVKTSESELQLGLESIGTESEVSQPNKTGYYEEYRRYLKTPDNHELLVTNHAWKVKGGYDTDSYDVAELDENKNIVARYKLYDSTKTSPPFDREIYSEKL
ncbi:HNH endonuclease [Photobacterium kishitanii]|uniref:PIN domain-containing protein n=1 Tax=Photobacterium kishitanii TaxID=318456 RepID=UPI000D15F1C2|nr:PIN domain-containing protein [Photobacterium kishitanii]PSV18238.1 HNH endonuclease [Photobacterium kishitanii]